jgi:hypothetical protein
MKILCCHGYASNGPTFLSSKAKHLVYYLSSDGGVEFVAPSGSSLIAGGRGARHAWWTFEPEFPLSDRTRGPEWWSRETVEYVGCDIGSLADEWLQGSFDGVLGFSQGAVAAAMLCAELERRGSSHPRFAILSHGFRSPLPNNPSLSWWRELDAGALKTPMLCVVGEKDSICAESEALGRLFSTGTLHVVPKGAHAVPKEQADLEVIRDFIVAQMAPSTLTSCEPCSEKAGQISSTVSDLRVCKAWARGQGCEQRGCPFRHSLEGEREERRAERARLQREQALHDNVLGDDLAHDAALNAKAKHGARHAEFARFLVSTFGREALSEAHGVLDVGGGRGGLSFELHVRHGLPTTLLEPRESISLKSNQRRELRKKPHLQPFRHVCARLGLDDDAGGEDASFESTAEGAALLAGASTLVGMHSDEATEPLVRAAVAYGKPFAVVPCCVFPRLHPSRRLGDGQHVSSHAQFCKYLMELAGPGCESALLPFEGRNRVIFRRCAVASQPSRSFAPMANANFAQAVAHNADSQRAFVVVVASLVPCILGDSVKLQCNFQTIKPG